MKIVLQAGHINAKNNSIVALRGNTGTEGEQEINKRITDRLAFVLRQRGFEVKQTDACANDDRSITTQDWNLFLAIHCDADYPNDGGGGFADYPEPKTDGASAESQRIANLINQTYFPETKILYRNRSNANTRYYYMWKYLSAKTPCVLIELGQAQDPHDKVLLANTDLICNALGRSICKAFGVNFDIDPIEKPCEEVLLSLESEIIGLRSQLEDANKMIASTKQSLDEQLAKAKADCQEKTNSLKASLIKIINETL